MWTLTSKASVVPRPGGNGDSLATARVAVSTIAGVGLIRREQVEGNVELFAAMAILGLSVGCGLATTRVVFEAMFSTMSRQSAFHVSPAPCDGAFL